jgi:hypothetical protein
MDSNHMTELLVETLRSTPRRLRTSELLRVAGVCDRRAGEDAIWLLVQRGRIRIGPDSTLSLTSSDTSHA